MLGCGLDMCNRFVISHVFETRSSKTQPTSDGDDPDVRVVAHPLLDLLVPVLHQTVGMCIQTSLESTMHRAMAHYQCSTASEPTKERIAI
jgi:hypothetical protein